MEITLTPELERLIISQVENGNYPSRSDVVRDALRLLEAHLEISERRVDALRCEIDQGIEAFDQGEYSEIDANEIQRLASDVKANGRRRLESSAQS